ncbi:MAG: hypothetical protein ACREXT_00660, partial [Gammaproteobacteria bacterium]
YSVILGEHMPHLVTEASSTTSEAVELRVADTIYANKMNVLLALKAIENYLRLKETSPIA